MAKPSDFKLNSDAVTFNFNPEESKEVQVTDHVPFTQNAASFEVNYTEFDSKPFDGALSHFALLNSTSILLFNGTEKSWKFYPEVSDKNEVMGLKYAAAAHLSGNKFMLCGGLYNGEPCRFVCIVDIKKSQGTITDESSLVQELIYPRIQHSLVVHRGRVYVLGGQSSKEKYIHNVERWEDNRWLIVPGMNTARSTFAAVTNEAGIYVAGGYQGPNSILGNIEKFTVETNAWNVLAVEFPKLAGVQGLSLPGTPQQFLLVGGSDGEGPTKTVMRLNSEDDSVAKEPYELAQPRARAIVVRCRAEVYVFGGGAVGGEHWVENGFVPYNNVPELHPSLWVAMPHTGDPTR